MIEFFLACFGAIVLILLVLAFAATYERAKDMRDYIHEAPEPDQRSSVVQFRRIMGEK